MEKRFRVIERGEFWESNGVSIGKVFTQKELYFWRNKELGDWEGDLSTLNKNLYNVKENNMYVKFEEMPMFEKEDLSTRHIVKLRGGAMCFIGEFNGGFRLHSKNYLGESTGVADLKEYKEDLKVKSNNEEYDIFAIKEFRSTSKAIGAIFNEEDIKWDWERDEKSPKQLKIKELQKSAKDLMDKAEDINKQISELNSEE